MSYPWIVRRVRYALRWPWVVPARRHAAVVALMQESRVRADHADRLATNQCARVAGIEAKLADARAEVQQLRLQVSHAEREASEKILPLVEHLAKVSIEERSNAFDGRWVVLVEVPTRLVEAAAYGPAGARRDEAMEYLARWVGNYVARYLSRVQVVRR